MKRKAPFLLLIFAIFLIGCQNKTVPKKPQNPNDPKPIVKLTKGVPILMYHKVNSNPEVGGLGLRVPENNFDWQMKYLYKEGFHTVTFQDLLDSWDKGKKLPDKPIVITFDDGYEDNLTKAYPILKKYNFTATIFVATDYVGKINEWDIPNGQPPNKMLTWNEVKELQNKGIDIEAHTMSHPHLAHISPEQAEKEIVGAKKVLEEKLGKKILFMAYPFGDQNKRVQKIVKKAGFLAAVVTDPQGKVDEGSNPFALKRVRIMGHYNNQTFVNVLNNPVKGYHLYLKSLKAKKKIKNI